MDSTIRRFNSFAEADEAEADYYAHLTPAQRLEILFDLVEKYRDANGETSDRLERIYRVVELERC